jgi:paraquat-inducible protein B
MIEANKYKLGIFVITGLALLVMVLFMLGISEAFKKKINFLTYFKESVQGLDIGSSVKFRGVTIGKVTRIAIMPKSNFIRVDMQARPSSIQPSEPGAEPVDFFKHLNLEVNRGLRCRLELAGITGMKYVELDYMTQEKTAQANIKSKKLSMIKNSEIRIVPPENILYIPSTPSLMAGLRTSLSVALARIANIDFAKMSNDISATLTEAKRLLSNDKINGVIQKMDATFANISKLTDNLNKSLSEDKLKLITKDIREALKNIKRLTKNADTELQTAKLSETTEAIRELKADLSVTASKLNNTLDAVTELAISIDDDPGSLIRGKEANFPGK